MQGGLLLLFERRQRPAADDAAVVPVRNDRALMDYTPIGFNRAWEHVNPGLLDT